MNDKVDIKRKHISKKLLYSDEARFRTIFNFINDAIFVHDLKTGDIIDVNHKMCEMYGYSYEEVLSLDVGDLSSNVPPYTQDSAMAWIRKAAAGKPQMFEWRAKDKRGRLFWVEINMKRARISKENLLLVVVRDINDRKEAIEKVHRQEAELWAIQDNLPYICWLKDKDGRYLAVNKFFLHACGINKMNDVIGKTDYDIWPKVVAEKNKADDQEVISSKKQMLFDEEISEKGVMKWYETFRTPVLDNTGNVIGTTGFSRNITENKKAEELVQEQKRFLRQIIDLSPNFIFAKDQNSRFTLVNYALADAYKVKPEDMVGKSDLDFNQSPEYAKKFMRDDTEVIKTGKPKYIAEEKSIDVHTGKERWLQTVKVPFIGPNGERQLMGACTDITERKKYEKEIKRLNADLEMRVVERTAQLESSIRELEAFSYSVSHDLRTPLRALSSFSRILLEDFAANLPEQAQRYLTVIEKNAIDMGHLIDDLLTFSRLSRLPLNRQVVDMNRLVSQVKAELIQFYDHKALEFKVDTLPACEGDLNLLRQVWVNLIDNALKFTAKKKKAIIQIGALIKKKTKPVYFVKDNGAGFDMQYTNKLFGVFQRLHHQDDFSGTGVGLAIVKRIIQRHEGRIWARSAVKEGSTFYFSL